MWRATGTPLSRSTFLKRSLSMQSADAATPAPTYGTPASSSSPCTVPSSPNGPWRMGRTTSTAPRVAGALAAGTGSDSATEPSPVPSSQRPSRPMATVTTSYSTGSSDSSTERAEASEISCSDDRLPARIATFSRLIEGRSSAALWPMSARRGRRGNQEVSPLFLLSVCGGGRHAGGAEATAKEGGSWGKTRSVSSAKRTGGRGLEVPHGSEPKASDAHGGPGDGANLPTKIGR